MAGTTRVSSRLGHWKVTALAQVDSPWDKHWDYFKAKINETSSVELEYFIRGEVDTEEMMLTALRRNRVQIGGITMGGLAGIIPEAAVPMIPFLFDSEAEVDFVFDNHLKPRFTEFLAERGLVFLDWSEVGWNNLYADKPTRMTRLDLNFAVHPTSPRRRFCSLSARTPFPLAHPTSHRPYKRV